MILSQTAEYSIRAIAAISLKSEGEFVKAKEISEETGIPPHYLSKILRKLVEADLLMATKGHNGGFCLARPAGKIRIVHVLDAVESRLPAKYCIFGWRVCNASDPCILHARWSEVNEAFQTWARQTSFADIQKEAFLTGWLARVQSGKIPERR